MPDFELSDNEKKVLSYCSRGVSKQTAVEKMSVFFSLKSGDIIAALDKLRRHGLVIESKGVAGVTVYMTSPLKVKSAMIDQRIVETLKELEQGGKAAGFKKKTFTADADTGEIRENGKAKPKSADLGFEVE